MHHLHATARFDRRPRSELGLHRSRLHDDAAQRVVAVADGLAERQRRPRRRGLAAERKHRGRHRARRHRVEALDRAQERGVAERLGGRAQRRRPAERRGPARVRDTAPADREPIELTCRDDVSHKDPVS